MSMYNHRHPHITGGHLGIITPTCSPNAELEHLCVLAQAALDQYRAGEMFEATFSAINQYL